MEFYVTLHYQDDGMLGTLFWEVNLEEGGLDHPNNLLPVGGVRRFFPRIGLQPGP